MLCYSDVVRHELKGPNHARKHAPNHNTAPPAWRVVLEGVHAFMLFPQNYHSAICMMQLETWFIGPHEFFLVPDRPILVSLCELEMFYLGNCRQQRCLNRPSAPISHMMQCMEDNLPTNVRLCVCVCVCVCMTNTHIYMTKLTNTCAIHIKLSLAPITHVCLDAIVYSEFGWHYR